MLSAGLIVVAVVIVVDGAMAVGVSLAVFATENTPNSNHGNIVAVVVITVDVTVVGVVVAEADKETGLFGEKVNSSFDEIRFLQFKQRTSPRTMQAI